MALIDTEGRCARVTTGKSTAWTGDRKSGKLIFSDHGLAPQADHTGAMSTANVGGHGKRHTQVPGNKKDTQTGKKYIVMEHQLANDEAKRAKGKIGLRKVKPYVHEQEKTRGKPGANLRGLTSEQRASINIQKMTHQDPTQLGVSGRELFAFEEKMQRETRVKEAAAHREALQAKSPQPNRAEPSLESAYTKSAPYAVVGGDIAPPGKKQALRKVEAPASAAAKPKPQGRSVDPAKFKNVPVPFDTVDPSKPYPDPPAVGSRTDPFAGRGKAGVAQAGQCSQDWDSVVRQRAANRPNIAPPERNENVIFGNPSPEPRKGIAASPKSNAGVGHGLLEHGASGGGSARNAGVRMLGAYKPTSLW